MMNEWWIYLKKPITAKYPFRCAASQSQYDPIILIVHIPSGRVCKNETRVTLTHIAKINSYSLYTWNVRFVYLLTENR